MLRYDHPNVWAEVVNISWVQNSFVTRRKALAGLRFRYQASNRFGPQFMSRDVFCTNRDSPVVGARVGLRREAATGLPFPSEELKLW